MSAKTIRRLLEFEPYGKEEDGRIPLKSNVEIDGVNVMVLPHWDFREYFPKPGVYEVEIEKQLHNGVAIAKPC